MSYFCPIHDIPDLCIVCVICKQEINGLDDNDVILGIEAYAHRACFDKAKAESEQRPSS